MKALKLLNFLFFGLLIACSSQTSSSIAEKATSDSAYKWTKVLDSGPWKKSYNFQLFSHGDSLWVFHPDGNWYSTDGKNWEKQDAPWSPRGGIAAVVFKNKIYLTGGKYSGTPKAPDFRYSNDLWTLERK